jgi:hypothetical protein
MDAIDKSQYVLEGVCFECKQMLSDHSVACSKRPKPRQVELPLWEVHVKGNQA